MSDDLRTVTQNSTFGASATVRTENPGRDRVASGRTEVGDPDYRRDPPHVTRNDQEAPLQEERESPDDVAALPSNASGHDRASADVVRGADSITFPGMLRPDELLERAGVHVPEEGPYETVGGFVMDALGRLPVVGDEVPVADGMLRVERLDGRRIDRIRYTPVTADAEGDDE